MINGISLFCAQGIFFSPENFFSQSVFFQKSFQLKIFRKNYFVKIFGEGGLPKKKTWAKKKGNFRKKGRTGGLLTLDFGKKFKTMKKRKYPKRGQRTKTNKKTRLKKAKK